MNQEKIKNIVRQILVLIGTALMFLKVDPEIIQASKVLAMNLTGVILEIIAFIGVVRANSQAQMSISSVRKISVKKAIVDVLKMK